MLSATPLWTAFVRSQEKTPALYMLVQLPTTDGSATAAQLLIPDAISATLSQSQDHSSNTASFQVVDNTGKYSSLNPNAAFGYAFSPGEIDKIFVMYMGFRGGCFINGTWTDPSQSLQLMFAGFTQTDQQDLQPFSTVKTVNLIDLTKQFRFQIADTFPHPLYGDQTQPYYDPTYNLIPYGPGDGGSPPLYNTWICPGKMFTQSASDPVYGSTHIYPAAFASNAGGAPSSTSMGLDESGSNFSGFDYYNGIATFTSAYPATKVISLAGNPTWMAPEVMIEKILVEKAQWDPNFIQLDFSNIWLPMYVADNNSAWDCLNQIADLTNPRYTPWRIRVGSNGVIYFQENQYDAPYFNGGALSGNSTNLNASVTLAAIGSSYNVHLADAENFPNGSQILITDGTNSLSGSITANGGGTGPTTVTVVSYAQSGITGSIANNSPVVFVPYPTFSQPYPRFFLDERDFFTAQYVKTSEQLMTLVRADATLSISDGAGGTQDQAIVSIAYDVDAINKYGLTEPLQVDSNLLQGISPLPLTTALSQLNTLTASILQTNSRPVFNLNVEISPDPSIEISDIFRVKSAKTGVDTYMEVTQQEFDLTPKDGLKQTLVLQEIPETCNYLCGIPLGASNGTPISQANPQAPNTSLIGAVRMGNTVMQFPYLNSNFQRDPQTGTQVLPYWDVTDNSGMHFDVFLNAPGGNTPDAYPWTYRHLPPGPTGNLYGWTAMVDPVTKAIVYVGTSNGTGGTWNVTQQYGVPPSGYTMYVGPDSVFYAYNHTGFPTAADVNNWWIPTGATSSPWFGGTANANPNLPTWQTCIWTYWYMCADSNLGVGKFFRPVMRTAPSNDAAPHHIGVGTSNVNGYWQNNTWGTGPGPNTATGYTKLLGNMAVGISDIVNSELGYYNLNNYAYLNFVGTNIFGDTAKQPGIQAPLNFGVAYGADAQPGTTYINYQTYNRAFFCILAASSIGATQYLRIPFRINLSKQTTP
jgi:hypothetical protein